MTTSGTGQEPSSGIAVDELVAEVRAAAGPEMVPSRIEYEDAARALLDASAGRMTREQAHQLGRTLNSGMWGGTLHHNRFMPGFSTPLVDRMTEDLETFNNFALRLWRGSEEDALAALDEIVRDRTVLPGSGRSFPSALLYLRDADRYAIWFDSLDRGLRLVADYAGGGRANGSDAYLAFCRHAHEFAQRAGLEPQELDAVLSAASRRQTERDAASVAVASAPTIPRAALDFLAKLEQNNNKEWFDANRERYEKDLRDPLADVFQALADDYVVGLDPEINVTVKRDEVLARINKYSVGDPYYPYLWGSFSRAKKQEDLQLFINVQATKLRYGLSLGSAPRDLRARLAQGIREVGDDLVRAIESRIAGHGLRWELEDDDYHELEITNAEELAAWAEGKDPHLARSLDPDHELIGSHDLVPVIGRAFEAIYPLAALAWDGDASLLLLPPGDEPGRPEYSIENLAHDTHLPDPSPPLLPAVAQRQRPRPRRPRSPTPRTSPGPIPTPATMGTTQPTSSMTTKPRKRFRSRH